VGKVLLRIVIPTFNRSERIAKLLYSLEVSSEDPRVEIVVVDDCSRKEARDALNGLAEIYQNVKFIFLLRNTGGAGARNSGALIGEAKWVWFVDDDDIVSSDTVLAVADSLASMCESESLVFLSANFHNGPYINKIVPKGGDVFKRFSRYGNDVNTSCAIFELGLFKSVCGWDESLVAGQDADLLLRVSELADVFVLEQYSVDIILHAEERITTNPHKQMMGKLQFIKKHWRRLHWVRLCRYMVTLIICYPFLRKWLFK
jgi:glycosyltransferase involved in cell wall biosynthesis